MIQPERGFQYITPYNGHIRTVVGRDGLCVLWVSKDTSEPIKTRVYDWLELDTQELVDLSGDSIDIYDLKENKTTISQVEGGGIFIEGNGEMIFNSVIAERYIEILEEQLRESLI